MTLANRVSHGKVYMASRPVPEPIRLLEDDETPVLYAAARYACSECGRRSIGPTHPLGITGKPRCLEPPELWGRT